jgi:hypothetical protein
MTSRTGESASFQSGQEAAPEHFVLAVGHVQAQHFPAAAVGGDAGGDHDDHGDDLGGGVAHVQVGRLEVDVRELGVVQRAGTQTR